MTRLRLRPYRAGDEPTFCSVPVSVVVLAKDEEMNIERCLSSVAWAEQVVVIDSGSSDGTVAIARRLGAEIVEHSWLGYADQRELALRHPVIRHDWVYFVDADEWISPQLATEIGERLAAPSSVAFASRFRLVFQGRWIRHCGWYSGSWLVRLMDRRHARYDGSGVGERVWVKGETSRLANDLVDEDLKGLANWLTKHVRYAELEAERRAAMPPLWHRVRGLRTRDQQRPFARALLKDVIYPCVPFRPVALFIYMYFIRLGFLDGSVGLRFCLYHSWFEATVAELRRDRPASGRGEMINEAVYEPNSC